VRRSERLLAAQSARIGIAKSDLLPHLSLVGSISLDSTDAAKFFEGRSFEAFGGPTFSWAILNYGRITNNVRVQDAQYQALVNDYTATVLNAQADVSALAGHRGSILHRVAAPERHRRAEGRRPRRTSAASAVDFTTVLLGSRLVQRRTCSSSRGQDALTVVTLYKSLGGGWEPWQDRSVVSDETAAQMTERTRWGDLIAEREQERIAEAAADGTEGERGWWRWRWWRPQW
jgi:outer membrane protein TolC